MFVNLYLAGETSLAVDNGISVKLIQHTDYPWDGRVQLTVSPDRASEFALCLRIPGWAAGWPVPSDLYRFARADTAPVGLKVNGTTTAAALGENGYVHIERCWQAGDVVELDLPMPVRRICGHPNIEADRGKFALIRGPVVYCLEAVDHPDINIFELSLPKNIDLRRFCCGKGF